MATGDKLIQVKDLKKYYNRGAIKALDGITVDIDRGDVMVVIGPSGSGKSTFLRSLNLLETPTGGSIIFDGVDITKPKTKNAEGKLVKVDIDQHRQKMGMVFQHFNLFPHMTIMDNMTLAPIQVKHMDRGEAEKKALALLDRVGLQDRARAYQMCIRDRCVGGRGVHRDYPVIRCLCRHSAGPVSYTHLMTTIRSWAISRSIAVSPSCSCSRYSLAVDPPMLFTGTVIKTPWPGTSSHRSRAAWRTSRGDRGDTQNSTAFSVASRPRKSSTSVVAVP